MFVQLKTGHDTDRGPCWISRVHFSKSWQSVDWHGLMLRREQGVQCNFVNVESGDEWWISGPKRDKTDVPYSGRQPIVEADVRAEYVAFLADAPLPGRERG